MGERPSYWRRAGARWRILAHQMLPGGRCGDSHDIRSEQGPDRGPSEVSTAEGVFRRHDMVLVGTELDEVVVGRWLHLEQLDTGRWHLNIGGVVVSVAADRDGRPVNVAVFGPGDYDEAVDGCVYRLGWSAESPP